MSPRTRERERRRLLKRQKNRARKREINRIIQELAAPPKMESKPINFGFPAGMGSRRLPASGKVSYGNTINSYVQSQGVFEPKGVYLGVDYSDIEMRLLATFKESWTAAEEFFGVCPTKPCWEIEAKEEEDPLLQQSRLLGLVDQFTTSSSSFLSDGSNGLPSLYAIPPSKIRAFKTLLPVLDSISRLCMTASACSVASLACSERSRSTLWLATRSRCSCRETKSSADSEPIWK